MPYDTHYYVFAWSVVTHLRHQSTEWAGFPPILHLISYTHVSIV